MKTIDTYYDSTHGFKDLSPGQTVFILAAQALEDGTRFYSPSDKYLAGFNEIQTKGDKELRLEFLKGDSDSILFLDNPDYDDLLFRKQYISTHLIPLSQDELFVKRWLALSLGNEDVISKGIISEPLGICDDEWGGIEDMRLKKYMLHHISQMTTEDVAYFMAVENDDQWAADFVIWRDKLKTRMKYKEV